MGFRKRKKGKPNKLGYALEDQVAEILEKLLTKGVIEAFIKTAHGSDEDKAGIDFIIFLVGGLKVNLGVTISLRCLQEDLLIHPDVDNLHFRVGLEPNIIENKLLELFLSKPEAVVA